MLGGELRVGALILVATCLIVASGCSTSEPVSVAPEHPEKLSEFGLFTGNGSTQEPAEGVVPYDLNSALFSDYTDKFRFVKLPAGQAAEYQADDVFKFPVGTIIAKTFAYPVDAREKSKGRRLLETRILKHEPDGWVGIPYIWNEEQTEATRDVAGDVLPVSWIDEHGAERKNDYIVPNANQCKGCHKQGDDMLPIGPKARHLNKDYTYHGAKDGDVTENQLAHWTRLGVLKDSPEPTAAPRLAVWNDPDSGTLDARARAWLEINCAHCHNPVGPARNSGLNLLASQINPREFGIYKTPVAAGRGSGGHEFDIVPGHPEDSIFMFRLNSTDAGIMMPELGKRLVHTEGVELIREWIAAMPEEPRPTR